MVGAEPPFHLRFAMNPLSSWAVGRNVLESPVTCAFVSSVECPASGHGAFLMQIVSQKSVMSGTRSDFDLR